MTCSLAEPRSLRPRCWDVRIPVRTSASPLHALPGSTGQGPGREVDGDDTGNVGDRELIAGDERDLGEPGVEVA